MIIAKHSWAQQDQRKATFIHERKAIGDEYRIEYLDGVIAVAVFDPDETFNAWVLRWLKAVLV